MALLNEALDYVFLTTYAMHDAFDKPKITNFQAPFKFDPNQPDDVYFRDSHNVVSSVDSYLKAGISPLKLFISYSGEGITLSNVEPGSFGTGLYQNFSGRGDGIWTEGRLPYYIIQDKVAAGAVTHSFNSDAAAVSAYDSTNKMFVSYDDAKTVQIKACYANFKHLAGTAAWLLYGDRYGDLLDAAYVKPDGPIGPTECEKKLNAIKNIVFKDMPDLTLGSDVAPNKLCSQYYAMFQQAEKNQLEDIMTNSEQETNMQETTLGGSDEEKVDIKNSADNAASTEAADKEIAEILDTAMVSENETPPIVVNDTNTAEKVPVERDIGLESAEEIPNTQMEADNAHIEL